MFKYIFWYLYFFLIQKKTDIKLIIFNYLFLLINIMIKINGDWGLGIGDWGLGIGRSEEHTSELQSQR